MLHEWKMNVKIDVKIMKDKLKLYVKMFMSECDLDER